MKRADFRTYGTAYAMVRFCVKWKDGRTMDDLKPSPCPICKKKAVPLHYFVDGEFDFGWFCGCPAFTNNDGVHGVTIDSPPEDVPKAESWRSKKDAIKKWNRWVEEWNRGHTKDE